MSSNQELPREKLSRKGAAALTDIELLQAIIGSGGKDNDFKQIARNLNATIQKIGIDRLEIDDIKAIKGIGDAKATIIFAALEFWRRKFIKQTIPFIGSAKEAAEQLANIKNKKQEYFVVLTLNGARRLINNRVIAIGTLTTSLIHPREVFSPAIKDRAASIIIARNRPSGVLDINEQDKKITQTIQQAGKLLGINLDDHIIVAGDNFVSALSI